MAVAEEAAAAWAIAWEIDKAAARGVKLSYQKAKELAMRFQNWKHKGGYGGSAATPATTGTSQPAGKKWSTEETYENTTYYSHTRTTKRTR
jgi:hypothetical protein